MLGRCLTPPYVIGWPRDTTAGCAMCLLFRSTRLKCKFDVCELCTCLPEGTWGRIYQIRRDWKTTSTQKCQFFFYVSLTMLCSITLASDQLDAQIFNTFITILYMYMFRAISCSPSGGQIVLTLRLLMSYIYMEHPFLMFLDHTQRRTTGRSPAEIVGSNPTRGMDICLLWVSWVVR